jgi:hypothetical protein
MDIDFLGKSAKVEKIRWLLEEEKDKPNQKTKSL